MKRLVLVALLVLAPALASAQPVPSGRLRTVTHDNTLTGAGTIAQALGLAPCGSPGQTWVWNGSVFACGSAGGTVTSVSGGTGVTVTNPTTTPSIGIDSSVWQARVTGTCTSPNAIRTISSTGTVTCTSGTLSTSNVAGTSGKVPVFTGTNTIGNSSISDDLAGKVLTTSQVGIGSMSSPAAQLDVHLNADATTPQSAIAIGNNFLGQDFTALIRVDSTKGVHFGTTSSNTSWKWDNSLGSPLLTLDTSGNLTAGGQLSSSRAAGSSPQLTLAQSGQKTWALYEIGSSDTFALWNDTASDVTRWDASGNLTQLKNFSVVGGATLGDSTGDTHTINGNVTHNDDGAGAYVLTSTPTARTTDLLSAAIYRTLGTFDTTGGDRISQTVEIDAQSTKSAGTGLLTNRALTLNASGGDSNQALVVRTGDFIANSVSGAAFLDGNTTIGDANTDAHTVNGLLTANGDATGHAITASSGATGTIVELKNTGASGRRYQLDSLNTGSLQVIDATAGAARLGLDSSGNFSVYTGALDVNSHQIHNVTDATSAQDAVTLAQLDAATTGANQVTGTLTSGTFPIATGAHTVGDSTLLDDGTRFTTVRGFRSSGAVEAHGQDHYLFTGLGCFSTVAATATCYINRTGTSFGTTNFRNLEIDDGKGVAVATFTGSTKGVEFFGSTTLDSTLAVTGQADLAQTSGDVNLGNSSGNVRIGVLTGGNAYLQSPTITVGSGAAATATHVVDRDGTSRPTATSCGTGAAVVGNDESGYLTVGTGATTSCKIVFHTAYSSLVGCVATLRSAGAHVLNYSIATTGITLADEAALSSGMVVDYQCRDH